MSDDWQPGDLALCVRGTNVARSVANKYAAGHAKMRKGGIYRVEAVIGHLGALGLIIEGHHSAHPTRAFLASAFKRVPPHTPDAEDAETIRLLTGKPAKAPC